MHESNIDNRVGALIFFAYIAAALFFSAFIAHDLIRLYIQCQQRGQRAAKATARLDQRRMRARLFASLASVSFAALSYHMLSFLIQSYAIWARQRSIATPERLYGPQGLVGPASVRVALHPWQWSKQSTLFRHFAEIIIDDPRRYWWTQTALLYSFGWNLYMAIEGVRRQVPHLWAYYVLAQILPISFAQNLFCVAVTLIEESSQAVDMGLASTSGELVVVVAYLGCLLVAPSTLGKPTFFPLVFAIRAILIMPYWLINPIDPFRPRSVHKKGEQQFIPGYKLATFVLFAAGAFLWVRQTLFSLPLTTIAKALNDNAAVATLGYDVVVGILSLSTFLAV